MALTKTTNASASYITSPTGTVTYTYAIIPNSVNTLSSAAALLPSHNVTRPGVFTAGTAPEGTISNTTNDSRS